MGSRDVVYGIYQDATEYCKPAFQSVQGAAKPVFQQRLMYVPLFYDNLLMFAVQLE